MIRKSLVINKYIMKPNKSILLYALIITLQIIVIVYWGFQKSNYYIDDLYSMGYASKLTGNSNPSESLYITTSSSFEFNKWMDSQPFKEHLLLSVEEKFYKVSPYIFLKKLIFERNYFCFLNISETIFGYSSVSPWPAIILNCIFFIIAQLSLISLLKKLKLRKISILLSISMFGFSCYIISAAVYIRFYMLIIMLSLIIFNIFYRLWNANSYKKIIFYNLLMAIMVYFAYMNSELTVFYYGGLMICFLIASFFLKKRRLLIVDSILSLFGVVYIAVATDYFDILFHPSRYASVGGVAEKIAGISEFNFIKFSIALLRFLSWLKNLFSTYYFSSIWIMVLFFAAIVGIITFNIKKGTGFSNNIIKLSSEDEVILVILGSVIIYTVLCTLCWFHYFTRYYCYGFVAVSILVWYIVDRIIVNIKNSKNKKRIISILVILVVINSLLPLLTRNIEYIYENETGFVGKVKSNQPIDVIIYLSVEESGNRNTISRHETYDCINLISPESRLYAVDINQYKYEKVDYPTEFMLWSNCYSDMTEIISDLQSHGYIVKNLGSDHCSSAYMCELK